MLQRRELVFKFPSPDTLATSSVTHWVTSLDHEFANYSVKYNVVVVAVSRMSNKIFNSFRSGFWKQSNADVTVCRMYDC